MLEFIFSGFGYELWQDKDLPFGGFLILQGDGELAVEAGFNNTFEAKKWMKDHKTSVCWRADGKWNWNRLEERR